MFLLCCKYLNVQKQKVFVNTGNSSGTRNVGHFGLLIKTGNIHKHRIISQTIIYTFKKCKGRESGGKHMSKLMAVPIWW